MSYWSNYPEIENHLNQVSSLIEERVQLDHPQIEAAIKKMTRAGGKYLRPAFFLLFSQFGQSKANNQDKLFKIVASLEILHMATLVHDDIIDDSPLRRGQTSIQTLFGKDVAVYTGDFLFTIFFELILEGMAGTDYMTINAKAMKKILIGELDQMKLYFNQEQSIDDYLKAISGKTAELFQLACQEGAFFGGADQNITDKATLIGFNIGMTFQILDDILDYTAEKEQFNKPVLEDLRNGVYSLPLLFAIKENPQAFKPYLDKKNHMTDQDVKKVSELVLHYQGVEATKEMAKTYTQEALFAIEKLPKIKAQKQLLKLSKHLLKRHL
ncbi:polyprenyl synthetase family protein [Streptococcus iniae]|uniref:polyprenyl synthetase family protein n=1 Tax=Streptococcus iniae TaxID=1346 RepID=UPI002B2E7B9A|nr:polyprenyl synthetase family protein [Streptococcus iniae]WNZ90062.1 polyprenyl synthetase family protein [Streptococcus iniae]WNZ91692.1 polyprenyl synthetase family protein [Streptococcus iniae]